MVYILQILTAPQVRLWDLNAKTFKRHLFLAILKRPQQEKYGVSEQQFVDPETVHSQCASERTKCIQCHTSRRPTVGDMWCRLRQAFSCRTRFCVSPSADVVVTRRPCLYHLAVCVTKGSVSFATRPCTTTPRHAAAAVADAVARELLCITTGVSTRPGIYRFAHSGRQCGGRNLRTGNRQRCRCLLPTV